MRYINPIYTLHTPCWLTESTIGSNPPTISQNMRYINPIYTLHTPCWLTESTIGSNPPTPARIWGMLTVTIRSNNDTTWALSKDPDKFVSECYGEKSQEQTDGVEDSVTDWLLVPVQCTLWLIDCWDRYRWSLIGTNAGQTPQPGKPNGPPQYSACSCPPHWKKG